MIILLMPEVAPFISLSWLPTQT